MVRAAVAVFRAAGFFAAAVRAVAARLVVAFFAAGFFAAAVRVVAARLVDAFFAAGFVVPAVRVVAAFFAAGFFAAAGAFRVVAVPRRALALRRVVLTAMAWARGAFSPVSSLMTGLLLDFEGCRLLA
ncbi:hypothetical protein ROTAS13_00120 [Roseomonas sp. TAS13]|nr:hypothetical protein ROTAS13_00120 [Roseomonas sp. TAS13]